MKQEVSAKQTVSKCPVILQNENVVIALSTFEKKLEGISRN